MAEIKNIHDKFVRERLSQKENAINFLESYLPSELIEIIDFSKIEIEKDTFITKELEEYFADLLYKVEIKGKESYIYVLLEHKSYEDKYVVLQLLEYMLKCWKQKKKDKEKLPIILPLLVYHGQSDWKYGNQLIDLLDTEDENLLKYIPNFEYILYDICRYTDEEIVGQTEIKLLIRLLKYGSMQTLEENFKSVLELLGEILSNPDKFITYMLYIIQNINIEPEKLAEIVSEEVSKEGGDLIMTTAQILMERGMKEGEAKGILKGKLEGKLEGILEGILEGKLEGILEGIELGLDIKFGKSGLMLMTLIRNIKDIEKLELIKERIRKADKLDEVEELLSIN